MSLTRPILGSREHFLKFLLFLVCYLSIYVLKTSSALFINLLKTVCGNVPLSHTILQYSKVTSTPKNLSVLYFTKKVRWNVKLVCVWSLFKCKVKREEQLAAKPDSRVSIVHGKLNLFNLFHRLMKIPSNKQIE